MTQARSSVPAVAIASGRRLPLFLVGAAASVVVGSVAAAWSLWYQTADFYCFWIAGRLVLAGRDPYHTATWLAATAGPFPDPRGFLSPAPCADRFAYPYWTAIVLAPFGALPVEAAAGLWMSLNVAAALGGALLAWRLSGGTARGRGLFFALVFSSQPFWTLLVSGQFTGVMLGSLALVAWALAADRQRAGGVALAALLIKPQFGVLVGPAVLWYAIARRRARLIAAAIVTALLLVVTAFALEPTWAAGWLAELQARQPGQLPVRPSAWGLSTYLFGDAAGGWLIIAATVVAIVALARSDALAPVPLVALTTALSLVVTPYDSLYDHLVLVLPWAASLAIAMRSTSRSRVALQLALLGSASLLPWILFAVWQRGGTATIGAIVPIVAALVLASALRLGRASR